MVQIQFRERVVRSPETLDPPFVRFRRYFVSTFLCRREPYNSFRPEPTPSGPVPLNCLSDLVPSPVVVPWTFVPQTTTPVSVIRLWDGRSVYLSSYRMFQKGQILSGPETSDRLSPPVSDPVRLVTVFPRFNDHRHGVEVSRFLPNNRVPR